MAYREAYILAGVFVALLVAMTVGIIVTAVTI